MFCQFARLEHEEANDHSNKRSMGFEQSPGQCWLELHTLARNASSVLRAHRKSEIDSGHEVPPAFYPANQLPFESLVNREHGLAHATHPVDSVQTEGQYCVLES